MTRPALLMLCLLLGATALIGGCGQKGALYFPDEHDTTDR